MALLNLGLVILSVVMLWKGADWFVESASKIAARFGMSDLAIGLTVMAFGTSAPELAVSVEAALNGKAAISLGNVVGSNIFNLGIILGLGALMCPLPVTRKRVVYRDNFLLIFGAVVFSAMAMDLSALASFRVTELLNSVGYISRLEGLALFGILVFYLLYLFFKKEPMGGEEEHFEKARPFDFAVFCFGLALIIIGGQFLVNAVIELARHFGVSEWLISVTIVAGGTSAPEMVTTLLAILKKRANMAIGNLLGSDIFNILGVIGVAAMVGQGLTVDTSFYFNILLLVAAVTLLAILLRIGWVLSRIDGAILLSLALVRWYLDIGYPPS